MKPTAPPAVPSRWLRLPMLALAAVLGMGLVAPSVALADPPKAAKAPKKAGKSQGKAPAAKSVDLELMVVHAKDGEAFVDPQLKDLEPHLQFLRYERFEVLSKENATVNGQAQSFQVEGGRKVTVSVLSKDDKRVRLQVQMYKGDKKLVDTTVAVNRGGTFVVAGPKYQGGMLLLPLTVRY